MIPFDITSDQRERARVNAAKIPETIRNSIRSGQGRLVGCLGEVLVADYLGVEVNSTRDYDLIYKGQKIDVKSKDRTVPPEEHFNCTVADFNTTQKCDYYFFVSILKNMSKGWLVGYLSKEDFYKKAKFGAKGESDGGGFEFRADCYNVPIRGLKPPVDMRKTAETEVTV